MEHALQIFEQACDNFQSPHQNARDASHQFLMGFVDDPHLFPVCDHLLRSSGKEMSLFHSAVCLRQGVIRRWQSLTTQIRDTIQTNLLEYAMIHANNYAVKSTVSVLIGAIAILLKRSWGNMSADAREAYFQALLVDMKGLEHHLLSRDAQSLSKMVGIQILTASVTEFSPVTATPLGLPWDYHELCRKTFQGFLKRIFANAVQIGEYATSGSTPIKNSDEKACLACLELLNAILNWDFEQTRQEAIGRPANEKSVIILDEPWLTALFGAQALDWVFKLLYAVHCQNLRPGSQVAIHARQLVITLCSVSGGETSSTAQGLNSRRSYTGKLLETILLWIQPPDTAVKRAQHNGGDEQIDACRALLALSRACSVSELINAKNSNSRCVHMFHTIADFLSGCLQAGGFSDEAMGMWPNKSTEMLLEFWSGILQAMTTEATNGNSQSLHSELVDLPKKLFDGILAALLKQAAVGALESEDEGDDGDASMEMDRFFHVASIGRACAQHSLNQVRELIHQKAEAITQPMNEESLAVSLEELVCLLQVGVALVADDVEGETATIHPTMMEASCHGAQETGNDPVGLLSQVLIEVSSLCLQPQAKSVISPRLMEVSIKVLTRWCDTYLFSTEPTSPQLDQAFGANANGVQVLQRVCEIANVCLVAFPGENLLHRRVCEELLPTLTHRKELRSWLLECPAWQQLFVAFASQEEPLKALTDKLHRNVARCLCTVAESIESPTDRSQYIARVMGNLAGELMQAARSADSNKDRATANSSERLCNILAALRGVALGTQHSPKSQKDAFPLFLGIFQPILAIQVAYKHYSDVIYHLLRFAGDLVEGYIPFLEGSQTQSLCKWVLNLLQIYSNHNLGALSMDASALLKDQREAEQGKDIRALLVLIGCIGDKEAVDFSISGGANDNVDIAEVVVVGLNIVVPLMTADLLEFPKVCNQYFELLAHVLEVYPERVAVLSDIIFQQIMRSLEFGLGHRDDRVVRLTLEALSGLMLFHCKEHLAGKKGLTARSIGGMGRVPVYFLKLLFQLLLLRDQGQATVEACATSLLCLMLSEQNSYQDVCHGVLPLEASQDVHLKLNTALIDLVQLTPQLDPLSRPGRSKFRSNLHKFVACVRGTMRVC